jgi:diguanylate cyclase (GGDEF)-like protein
LSTEEIQEFEDFEELETHYRTHLPLNIENIYHKILKVSESKKLHKKDISDIKNDVHKIAGSAGSFGFVEVSNTLRALDVYLSKFISGDKDHLNINEIDINHMKDTILEINKILIATESAKEHKPENVPTVISSSSMWYLKKFPDNWNRKVVVCDHANKKYLSDLKTKLAYFGYEIQLVNEIDALKEKMQNEDIHLVILDTDLVMKNSKFASWLKKYKEKHNSFRVFYISANNDFKTRLYAIRHAGDAFFESTIDVPVLANKIEYFADNRRTQPDHILIVDDDIDTLSYYAQLFQHRGMITSVTTDPFSVFDLIVDTTPDLILIDMLMPRCNGIELTSMIRQHDEFLSTPIIIYSVFDKPISADFEIASSGYEFISKFTDDNAFASIVINRIDRARSLKYFMERDSLTGLLNHSNICESFQRELLRAKRTNLPLSYAIVDIDNFKSINDTYGHFVGDTVLKSLSYMLMERLRGTDIVGRYGGEEFVVIMGNTSAQSAKRVVDILRRNFSKMPHNAFSKEFNVTFSCGISGYPEFSSAKTIFENADKALYTAKRTGKNKTIVYQNE